MREVAHQEVMIQCHASKPLTSLEPARGNVKRPPSTRLLQVSNKQLSSTRSAVHFPVSTHRSNIMLSMQSSVRETHS